MEIAGKLLSRRGNVATIELSEPDKLAEIDKFGTSVVSLLFEDGRSVSHKQRNFAYALIGDIANAEIGGKWAGNPELVKRAFKYYLDYYNGIEDFSLANGRGNMSDANEFISLLLEFCLNHNVPLSRRPLDHLDDPAIARYEYACLMNKRCAICGLTADHHHITGSKVGMGNDRTKINHRGRRLIALCRQHHDLFHHEEKERMAEYHLQGVPVDEKIAKIYNLNYW